MNFRKITGYISLFSTLLALQDSPTSETKCENASTNLTSMLSSNITVHYIPGGGKDFVSCVNNNYRHQFVRIKNIFGVKNSSTVEVEYGTLDGIGGFYSLDSSKINLDTGRVLYVTGIADCNVLGHELVHAFEDRKSKELGNGKWPLYSTNNKQNFNLDDYGINIVSEGLASYIGDGIERTKFPPDWPQNRETFYCADKYVMGEYLVTRPIRELGPERAIPLILQNPPKRNQVLIPSTWQNYIVNKGRAQTRNHR